MPESPYLRASEAAGYVRAPSVEAFLAWARRHGVPRHKRGRVVLFTVSDLDAAVSPETRRSRLYLRHGGRR